MKKYWLLMALMISSHGIEITASNNLGKTKKTQTWWQRLKNNWKTAAVIGIAAIGAGRLGYKKYGQYKEEAERQRINAIDYQQQQVGYNLAKAKEVTLSNLSEKDMEEENLRQQQANVLYAKDPGLIERLSLWWSGGGQQKIEEKLDKFAKAKKEIQELPAEELQPEQKGWFDSIRNWWSKDDVHSKIDRSVRKIEDAKQKIEEKIKHAEQSRKPLPKNEQTVLTDRQMDDIAKKFETDKAALKTLYDKKLLETTSPMQRNKLNQEYSIQQRNLDAALEKAQAINKFSPIK